MPACNGSSWTKTHSEPHREYIRAFRVQDTLWATAHVLRPVASVQYDMQSSWSVTVSSPMTRRSAFQEYDNLYSSFYISYVRPLHRSFNDDAGEYKVAYPLRFSFGIETEQFPDFTGTARAER